MDWIQKDYPGLVRVKTFLTLTFLKKEYIMTSKKFLLYALVFVAEILVMFGVIPRLVNLHDDLAFLLAGILFSSILIGDFLWIWDKVAKTLNPPQDQ